MCECQETHCTAHGALVHGRISRFSTRYVNIDTDLRGVSHCRCPIYLILTSLDSGTNENSPNLHGTTNNVSRRNPSDGLSVHGHGCLVWVRTSHRSLCRCCGDTSHARLVIVVVRLSSEPGSSSDNQTKHLQAISKIT